MHAGAFGFPMTVQGILCVPVTLAHTIRERQSLDFFLPHVVLMSSLGIRIVYLGNKQKKSPVSSMFLTHSGSYCAITEHNTSNAANNSGFYLSTSPPSP